MKVLIILFVLTWCFASIRAQESIQRYEGLSVSGEKFIYVAYDDNTFDEKSDLRYKIANLTLKNGQYPERYSEELRRLCGIVDTELKPKLRMVDCSSSLDRKTLTVTVLSSPGTFLATDDVWGPARKALRKFFPDPVVSVVPSYFTYDDPTGLYKGPWRSRKMDSWHSAMFLGKDYDATLEILKFQENPSPYLRIQVRPEVRNPKIGEPVIVQEITIIPKDGKFSVQSEWYYDFDCMDCGACQRSYRVLPRNWWKAIQRYGGDLPAAFQEYLTAEVLAQVDQQATSKTRSTKPRSRVFHACT